jgi:hypothetical protein
VSRIDELVQLEALRDGDDGDKFSTEQATFAALQRRLAARCRSHSALWVPLRQSELAYDEWSSVTRPKILNSVCEWYAFGDET